MDRVISRDPEIPIFTGMAAGDRVGAVGSGGNGKTRKRRRESIGVCEHSAFAAYFVSVVTDIDSIWHWNGIGICDGRARAALAAGDNGVTLQRCCRFYCLLIFRRFCFGLQGWNPIVEKPRVAFWQGGKR